MFSSPHLSFSSVTFYMKFLNQSLQLLYTTTATVDHCNEPDWITASFGKLWNESIELHYKYRLGNPIILCPYI